MIYSLKNLQPFITGMSMCVILRILQSHCGRYMDKIKGAIQKPAMREIENDERSKMTFLLYLLSTSNQDLVN